MSDLISIKNVYKYNLKLHKTIFAANCWEVGLKAWQSQRHLVNLEQEKHSFLTHFVVSLYYKQWDSQFNIQSQNNLIRGHMRCDFRNNSDISSSAQHQCASPFKF